MQESFVGVSESDTVADAAAVMAAEECDAIVVLRGNDPIGQLTVHDVLEATVEGDPESATVGDLGPRPVETVEPSDSAAATHDRLLAEGTRAVVVSEADRPVGLITDRDLALAANGYEPEQTAGAPEGPTTVHEEATTAHEGTAGTAAAGTSPTGSVDETDRSFEHDDRIQSVCEVCGTLSASLEDVNGELRCPNCVDV